MHVRLALETSQIATTALFAISVTGNILFRQNRADYTNVHVFLMAYGAGVGLELATGNRRTC